MPGTSPHAIGGGDPLCLGGQAGRVTGGEQQVDTLGGEALGDRKPDADAAARDDGSLALQA
jgi:hypothetical protein